MKLPRIYLLFIFFMTNSLMHGLAQKPSIDTIVLGKWPEIQNPMISSDGKYSLYFVENAKPGIKTLFIASNDGGWNIQIPETKSAAFSGNGRLAFYLHSGDSLTILDLKKHAIRNICKVSGFKVAESNISECIAYLQPAQSNKSNKLVVRDLATAKKSEVFDVNFFRFSKDGKILLVSQAIKQAGKEDNEALDWIDLDSGKSTEIWKGVRSTNWRFDDSCRTLAFIAKDEGGIDANYSVFFYSERMKCAKKVGIESSDVASKGFSIEEDQRLFFSKEGDKLIFTMVKNKVVNPFSNTYSNVNIWNYSALRTPADGPSPTEISFVALLNSDKILQLTQEGEKLDGDHLFSFENYVVAYRRPLWKNYLNGRSDESWYIVSTNNGERKLLIERQDIQKCLTSPDERFVIWFNPDSLNYFSYEVVSGQIRNISYRVKVPLYDMDALKVGDKYCWYEIGGYNIQEGSVYIEDKYDIWKVDLQGLRAPVNMTNSYGRINQVVFEFLNEADWPGFNQTCIDARMVLVGYNPVNKSNGFWSIGNIAGEAPAKLTMEPASYYIPRTGSVRNVEKATGLLPIKAKDANAFLVQRMSADVFPNLYFTRDFKSFKQISHLYPEKVYNWLITTLLHWQVDQKKIGQGVLYKPENFDPTKKYPVIFDYYAKRSDELNQYIEPDWCHARINIPYFVSSGYLVFVPDIYYEQGHNGKFLVRTIESAAHFLSQFSWVDSTRMGLQGHSFGGWETNFLVTHSKLFAAACEGSGVSDQISSYDELETDGRGRQEFYEVDQQGSPYGIGVTPWTRPELYIENSPVLNAGKVTTPLLMMHGEIDDAVPYIQGVEMFLALRRAGKRVWLLQYKQAGHILWNDDARDYTVRMKQFFDHYLKNMPPPKWMIDSGFERRSEIGSDLEPDKSGQEP